MKAGGLAYLDTIQVKSTILYFKHVLFKEIWLTYGTAWVSETVFSNFEGLNTFFFIRILSSVQIDEEKELSIVVDGQRSETDL
jgi:hypothetical protein